MPLFTRKLLGQALQPLRRGIALALVVAPILLVFQPLPARAGEVLFKNGYSEIISDPEEISEIRMRVGFKTLLLFPSDEKIVRIEVGLRGSILEVKYGVNWVALRPSEEKVATSLDVATDKGRVYSFNLQEGAAKAAHRKVVILRPDMDLDPDGGPAISTPSLSAGSLPSGAAGLSTPRPAAPGARPGIPSALGPNFPSVPGAPNSIPTGGTTSVVKTAQGRNVAVDDLGPEPGRVAPGQAQPPQVSSQPGANNANPGPQGRTVPGMEVLRKLDKNYTIKNGNPKLFSVDSVNNDGERTFVRFKSRLNEAPLFYRINEGKREILTYRLETGQDPRDPDMFVIPRLFDQATVRVGESETIIIWNATK